MKTALKAFAFVIALASTTPASAQTDPAAMSRALGDCLAAKSTGEDRVGLAGWMVSALSSAPQLKGVAEVSPEKREQLDRNLARIFTRLVTVDCASEAKPLIRAGKMQAFSASFEVLGRLAMQELTSDPAAGAAMGKFAEYIDLADLEALRK